MQNKLREIVIYADREKLIREKPRSIVWRVPFLYNLFFAKPVVVINDEGIVYHPPKVGPFAFQGSIKWEDIKAIYLGELTMSRRGRTQIQKFFCILPQDEEQFLQPFSLLNKTILTILMLQVGTPFALSESLLTGTVDQLLARIQTDYSDLLQKHQIEIREVYRGSLTASK